MFDFFPDNLRNSRLITNIRSSLSNGLFWFFSAIPVLVLGCLIYSGSFYYTNPLMNELIATAGILIVLSSLYAFLVSVLFFKAYFSNYAICNTCNKSSVIKYNWTCDHCHNEQGESVSIFSSCKHCQRKLDTFVCEYCESELSINADKS